MVVASIILIFLGADRFRRDVYLMIGQQISYFWCIAWKYLTLGTISLILFFNFYFQKPIVYEDYLFPSWSVMIGWTLAVCGLELFDQSWDLRRSNFFFEDHIN
jgi:Sodium:neurotransmitter symporter family